MVIVKREFARKQKGHTHQTDCYWTEIPFFRVGKEGHFCVAEAVTLFFNQEYWPVMSRAIVTLPVAP